MRDISIRVIATIAGGLVALFVLWAAWHFYQKTRSQAAQSRVERSQAEAQSNSSAAAVNTVAASGEASAASEALTRSNEKEIRDAKGSDAPVDPAARDAGLRALCLRRAYSADPKCRVQQPHP
jgi:Flp pilus assembly protein TadB